MPDQHVIESLNPLSGYHNPLSLLLVLLKFSRIEMLDCPINFGYIINLDDGLEEKEEEVQQKCRTQKG
jgi:hypothetical protein